MSSQIVTVALPGEYDLSSKDLLEAALRPVETARAAVIDLTQTKYLDSSCIAALLKVKKSMQTLYGSADLRIAGANRQILRIFSVSGLDHVFSMYPTVPEALAGVMSE